MIPSVDEKLNTRAKVSFVELDHTKALRLGLYCVNRPDSRHSELSWCQNSLVGGCIPEYISNSKPQFKKFGAVVWHLWLTALNRTCN